MQRHSTSDILQGCIRKHRPGLRRREQGSYLVMAAFVLVVLILASALSVDVSRKFSLEQNCQDIADAAALAGANLLPDVARARLACSTYIQSVSNNQYWLEDSSIQIRADLNNRSCTIGVIVAGKWDAVLMPTWLMGDDEYRVQRFAVAVMAWETEATRYSAQDTLGNMPGGPWALFLGDTSVASFMSGNSNFILGTAHFNGDLTISTSPQNQIQGGNFEVAGTVTGGGGITPVASSYVTPPTIDNSGFVFDVVLDENNAALVAYYTFATDNTAIPLLASNGVAVPNTLCRWDAGTSTWRILSNGYVTPGLAGQTANWGNGVDVNIIGQAAVSFPNGNGGAAPPDNSSTAGNNQNYWIGSFQSTKKLSVLSNNSELRCVSTALAVAGLDNPGLAFNAGTTFTPGTIGFDNRGNVFDIYGVLATPATINWTAPMNNYNAGDQGTPGAYDIGNDNGFIKGSVIAGSLTSTSNNFKVYYDGVLTPNVPIINPATQSPPRYSTPTVWLSR